MSFLADSLTLRRKCTATERAANNEDPLVARKRAREATKLNAALGTAVAAAKPAAAPESGPKVSQHHFSAPLLILYPNR